MWKRDPSAAENYKTQNKLLPFGGICLLQKINKIKNNVFMVSRRPSLVWSASTLHQYHLTLKLDRFVWKLNFLLDTRRILNRFQILWHQQLFLLKFSKMFPSYSCMGTSRKCSKDICPFRPQSVRLSVCRSCYNYVYLFTLREKSKKKVAKNGIV